MVNRDGDRMRAVVVATTRTYRVLGRHVGGISKADVIPLKSASLAVEAPQESLTVTSLS